MGAFIKRVLHHLDSDTNSNQLLRHSWKRCLYVGYTLLVIKVLLIQHRTLTIESTAFGRHTFKASIYLTYTSVHTNNLQC